MRVRLGGPTDGWMEEPGGWGEVGEAEEERMTKSTAGIRNEKVFEREELGRM